MTEHELSDQDCQRLLDRLVSALHLDFVDAKGREFVDGWYLWRNSQDWPVHEYAFYQVVDNKIQEPEPVDSYGAVWEMGENDVYGQLAGPILGR